MFSNDNLRHEIEFAQDTGRSAALLEFNGVSREAIAAWVYNQWPAGELSFEKWKFHAQPAYRKAKAELEHGRGNQRPGSYMAYECYGSFIYLPAAQWWRYVAINAGVRGVQHQINFAERLAERKSAAARKSEAAEIEAA